MTKSILITGCSSGIGYDAARGLTRRGWRVFATCRKQADRDRLVGEGFESFLLDYDDPASITAAVNETMNRTGGTLDALFNNGAYAIPGALEDLPRDAMRAIFESNLIGYHDLIRQVIPAMRLQGYGRIVNCSSVLGLVAWKWRGAYTATKFALEGLSDTLRIELKTSGIHVCLIEPGPVTSDFRKNAIINFEKWIDWQRSAQADAYGALLDRLYQKTSGPERFELPASAVTQRLVHAIENRRPKARYYVTKPTYVAAALRRVLPERWLDAILSRV